MLRRRIKLALPHRAFEVGLLEMFTNLLELFCVDDAIVRFIILRVFEPVLAKLQIDKWLAYRFFLFMRLFLEEFVYFLLLSFTLRNLQVRLELVKRIATRCKNPRINAGDGALSLTALFLL